MVYNDYSYSFNFQKYKKTKSELLIGDFKRFTSKAIVNAIINNPKERNKLINEKINYIHNNPVTIFSTNVSHNIKTFALIK